MRGRRLRTAGARALIAGLLAAAASAPACTEDALTGPGPSGDGAAETVEVTISPDEFALWRDTTYSSFALPLDADFLVAADPQDSTELHARALLRYEIVPDSVEIDSVDVAIDSFVSAELRLALDTARSRVPDPGVRLRLFGLARPYTPTEVTWEQAADGEPWSSPGGDLAGELGSLDLQGAADSVLAETLALPIREDAVDSLLAAWRDGDGGAGAALLVEGPGARLRLIQADLRFEVRPEGRDTTVARTAVTFLAGGPSTFVHDPPLPPTGTDLRLGGLPSSRAYLSFVPPDSADGVGLRGATINRADLLFRPTAPPSPPFRLDFPVSMDAMELIADPFELGARTPIGPSLTTQVTTAVDPDSLAEGRPLRVEITPQMGEWAAKPDSFGVFRLGLRLRPDGQTVNFWEFGSGASAPEVRPVLRLIVTPPSGFDLP